MNKIRILIAEDHATVRAGLSMLFNAQGDLEVIGEADNGHQAISLTKDLQPDVLMVDISMPVVSGLVVTATVKRTVPFTRILALTRHSDRAYLQELLQAGVSGYVLKQSDSTELLRAIRAVAAGGEYLDPAITGTVMGFFKTGKKPGNDLDLIDLTEREVDVLRRTARGYCNSEIADQLDVSTKTVEAQKNSALRKLNIKGRTEIVRYAIRHGWLRGI